MCLQDAYMIIDYLEDITIIMTLKPVYLESNI